MIGEFLIDGKKHLVDFSKGQSIAIPLLFGGPQPSHFGANPATAIPLTLEGFVGSTKQGGSCNVPVITLNPHCNGTHTETVGHIVNEEVPIYAHAPRKLLPATLISIEPISASTTTETYRPALESSDWLLTSEALRTALQDTSHTWCEAVVIRTLPNESSKSSRQYGQDGFPPFLTIEAIDYLLQKNVQHLLLDLPSVDKMYDAGLLTVHHRFWNLPEGTHRLTADCQRNKTITEMIFVPDEIPDGSYLLNLQVPVFCTDVAPSRPILYPVE